MDGVITFITLGHHGIADPLPVLVPSRKEPVEVEEGKHASSLQWILCTSPQKFHRMKLMSQGWYLTKQIGDAISTQFLGSICSSRKIRDFFWQTICNAIILSDSMQAECLVQVIKCRTHEVFHQKPDQSLTVRQRLSHVPTGSANQSALGNQVQGNLARLLWLWYPWRHSNSGSASKGDRSPR